MKYLLELRGEMQTFIKSDMLYAALPIWFLIYSIFLLSSVCLPIGVIYTVFQDGVTEYVISNAILSLICVVISHMLSPEKLVIALSNDTEGKIEIKKEYVLVGKIFVSLICALSTLIYLVSKYLADTGTL